VVADLVLDDADQRALRELTSAEPLDDGLAGAEQLLLNLSRLIPCDFVGVGIGDSDGYLLDEVTLPRHPFEGGMVCDGPLLLGIHVWSREAEHRELLETWGMADGMAVGFRGARGLVMQVYLDRVRTPFSSRDLQLLHLVTPTLDRLLSRPAPRLPACLTPAERRVLQLVAAGFSNADIASRVGVAPSTVRKHLEHAYRKLGVSNRLAAVVRFDGGPPDDPDREERIARLG
jgi:DNA-binding CsgD family transcriptional regulator